MPASIIGSFFSFLITGIYTYWIVSFNLSINPDIKVALFLAIIANAFYFFYIEALTEIDDSIKTRLRNATIWEWIIRIINQFILFSLWFLLQWNLLAFAFGLVLLYSLFIIWDRITKEYQTNKYLYYTDIGGLVLTVSFLLTTYLAMNTQPSNVALPDGAIMQPIVDSSIQFYWGVCVILYLFLPIIGLIFTKFRLFHNDFWARQNVT